MLRYNGHAHAYKIASLYVSTRNKLFQLVIQVQYHVNVIYSLGGGHTHTDVADKSNWETIYLPTLSQHVIYR